MKKLSLTFSVFVVIFLNNIFANEINSQSKINQTLSFSQELEAREFTSYINITASPKLRALPSLNTNDKNKIIATYNAINAAKSAICKGGSFSLNPLFTHKDGRSIQSGFESNFSLECEFEKAQKSEFDMLLNKIEREVLANDFLEFTLPQINAKISQKDRANANKKANIELLKIAQKKAQEYSNQLNLNCKIGEISLNAESNEIMPLRSIASTQMLKSQSAPSLNEITAPDGKEINTTSARVSFVCSEK